NSAASSSFFTIADSASMMWVCGVIGYAQITCGRHIATASATARDPSICLSIGPRLLGQGLSLVPDEIECGPGGGVAFGDRPGDRLAGPDRLVVDPAGRQDRRARPLRAEARERLRVPVLAGRGRGQQRGGGDRTVAASPAQ